jgi:hypothetical protein
MILKKSGLAALAFLPYDLGNGKNWLETAEQ